MTDQEASDALTVKYIEAIQHLLLKMMAQAEFNANVFLFLQQEGSESKFKTFIEEKMKEKKEVVQ